MWLESRWPSSVAQFCHHKAPEEQGQDKFDPFASNFLVKGWSSLCSRRKKKILSSGCARAGSIKDASTAVTIIVHFWFSSLCFLPLAVLSAVERQGGNSLSQQLCLHNPMDGAGQGSQGTAQPATPVTQGKQGCGALGQRVRQNRTKWCLSCCHEKGGSPRRANPSLLPD